jgi:hypothetical protein
MSISEVILCEVHGRKEEMASYIFLYIKNICGVPELITVTGCPGRCRISV